MSAVGDWAHRQGVTHVVLSETGDYVLEDPDEGMVVYWWNDRPVGHEFVDGHNLVARRGRIPADVLAKIRAEEAAASRPLHSASLVVCTRDRPGELQRCLASLREQTYQPREIIVVDNASRDGRTREVAREAGAIYLREERVGLDYARNTGARHATSAIVAYTDDDVLLHPRWLERLAASFRDQRIAAVTGLVLPAELATEAQRHFETYWGFGRGYLSQNFDSERFSSHAGDCFPAWEVGAGASMAFRREMFAQAGFFDERLDVGQAGCSGDSELWYRLLAMGYAVRYEPSAVAFHFHRETMEALARQIYSYMRGHAASLLIQHERTGIAGNRSRAFSTLPRWYAHRIQRCLLGKGTAEDRLLKEEVTGYLSGLVFYYRNRRRNHGSR